MGYVATYPTYNIELGVSVTAQRPIQRKEELVMMLLHIAEHELIAEFELEEELQDIRDRYGPRQSSNLCSCLIESVGDRPIALLSNQECIEFLDDLQSQLIILGDPADCCFASQFDLIVEWDLPEDWFSQPYRQRQRILRAREEVLTKILGKNSSFFIHELDLGAIVGL
ncbi:MAG: hypothetical protein GX956_06010 [Firmicutes bacterium]|nr:hypothetical protein [Bacillota bacterium]